MAKATTTTKVTSDNIDSTDLVEGNSIGVASLRQANKDGTYHRVTITPDDDITHYPKDIQDQIAKVRANTSTAWNKFKKDQIESVVVDRDTAIQALIDQTARSYGYQDGASLVSYMNSTVAKWAEEAKAFNEWRDQVWLKVNQVPEQMRVEEIIADLPAIKWPTE